MTNIKFIWTKSSGECIGISENRKYKIIIREEELWYTWYVYVDEKEIDSNWNDSRSPATLRVAKLRALRAFDRYYRHFLISKPALYSNKAFMAK